MKQKIIGRRKFERLPNVVPVMDEEPDFVCLFLRIVKEDILRLVNHTDETSDLHSQSLKEILQDEVERILEPVAAKPSESRRRQYICCFKQKFYFSYSKIAYAVKRN
ncbi:CCHC-type domain-containing protein [Nephila pilipes]|uniref:CCHC-type domain-containing protein n=1 Tax=Nephila pilipes TaxID=299642 RepID=A0A8X6TE40_NEPPI|nr:CCHC-type domain-containing protein [Nephila pilipes]